MKIISIKEILRRKLNMQAVISPSPLNRPVINHVSYNDIESEPVQRRALPFPSTIEQNYLSNEDFTGTTLAVLNYPTNRNVFPAVNALLVDINADATNVQVETTWDEPLTLDFIQIQNPYKPVFELLSKTSNRFVFGGHVASDGNFYISGIHVYKKNKMLRAYEANRMLHEEQLHWCLRMLSDRQNGKPFCTEDDSKLTFKTPPEFRLLLLAAPERFPDSIRSWATNELALLEEGGLGSDEEKHMITALTYVLNTDWSDGKPIEAPDEESFRKALDEKIVGLDNVKEALTETISYMATGQLPKYGLLLVGPPGTCKTVLAKTFAQLANLPCAEVDFSAKTDINSLVGSPRLYANARPGAIAHAMLVENRSKRLLLLVNELDKISVCKNSENIVTDPSTPLLNVLCHDPFHDEFLECPIPTDEIYCVATANSLDTISEPLLSRYRIIEVSPYSAEEKRDIFNKSVLPCAVKRAHLPAGILQVSDSATNLLMEEYATDPGCRDIEQQAERLVQRHLRTKQTVFTSNDIRDIFGPSRTQKPVIELPGEAIGLYQKDMCMSFFKIQVEVVAGGTGRFETFNIGLSQRGFAEMALLAVKDVVDEDLDAYDIFVSMNQLLPETTLNYVGLPTAAAIWAGVKGISLTSHEAFVGGCDLHGNVLTGGLDPLIAVKSTVGRGYVLFGAPGCHIVDCHHDGIIEVGTIQELISWLEIKRTTKEK